MYRFRPASTTVGSTFSTGSMNPFPEESPQSLVCPVCDVQHVTMGDLRNHQSSNMHFACDQCEQCYWTQEALQLHKRKDHPADQDIECPGCKSHFTRAFLFWQHVDQNQCKVIVPSDVAEQRERKLEFAKQLELRGPGLGDVLHDGRSHINKEDTWASHTKGEALAIEPMMATLELRPGAFSPNAHPAQYRNEDFPVIPSSRLRARPGDFPPLGGRASHHANYNHAAGSPVVPGISGERRTNAWKEEKVLFPDTSAGTPVSYNSVPPQASYSTPLNAAPRGSIQQPASNNKIQTIPAAEDPAESGRHTTTSSGRIIDPNHPDFNAAVFYNDLLNKFVCPYKLCRKKVNSAHALAGHLRSPAHTGGRLGCICCKKVFTTPAALIEHMEMTTTCSVRETDNFRRALGDLTGGLIDVDTRLGLGNGITKFVINEKAFRELCNSKFRSNTGLENKGKEVVHAPVGEQRDYWNNPEIHW